MDILKLYTALLNSMNVEITDDSYCSFNSGDIVMPLQVDGKRLVLPTRDILRDGNWEQRIAFHPLAENPTRTESAVLKKLKSLVQVKLSASAIVLMRQLIHLAVDTGKHASLSPKAQRLLVALSDADAKFAENFDKVIYAMSPPESSAQHHHMVSIYLKKGGLYKDRSVLQLGVVSFPLAHALSDSDGSPYGVKLRRKDEKLLAALLEFVFPNHNDISEYAGPSDSMMAPRFDALLKAYANVAAAINKHVKTFRKYLEDDEDIEINLDWLPLASDLSVYRGQIPALNGNEGNIVDDEASTRGVAVQTSDTPRQPQRREEDSPPWEEPKLSTPSKFNLDGVRAALSEPSRPPAPAVAPFHQPQPTQQPQTQPGTVDYHGLMARRNAMQQPTQACPPPPAIPPQQMPTWVAPSAPQQQPLRPGDYAHRPNMRSANQPMMGYAYPQPQPPHYVMAPPPPMQFVGGGGGGGYHGMV